MKPHWCLFLVFLAFLAGWGTGRSGVSKLEAPDTLPDPLVARASPRKNTGGHLWTTELSEMTPERAEDLVRKIPRAELGPALESWLAGFGIGGLDGPDLLKLRNILDSWAGRDFDGAWHWATGLKDPSAREFAITGLAGSIAERDPRKAFECLVAQGEFRHGLHDRRLEELMSRLSKEAYATSPEALVALWKQLPLAADTVNGFTGIGFDPGPDADFGKLLNLVRSELGPSTTRPYNLHGIMREWALVDREAAGRHVAELAETGGDFSDEWSELRSAVSSSEGADAVNAWALGLLRSIPEETRGDFIVGAGMLNSPQGIFDLIQAGAGEEETAGLIKDIMQASVDRGKAWGINRVLDEVPLDQRIAYVKSLRGVEDFPSVAKALEGWMLAPDVLTEIEEAVTRPAP